MERDLQKFILAWLKAHNYFFLWSRMDKRPTGIKGTPDFVFQHRDRFIAVECKTDKGKLRPEQEAAFKKITRQGGDCFVVRTVDQFIEALK